MKKAQEKVKAVTAKTIFDLEESLNDFGRSHNVFATQIFPLIEKGETAGYDAIIHYREMPMEDIMEKGEEPKETPQKAPQKPQESEKKGDPITSKQVKALVKNHGYKEEDAKKLTKQEAWAIINKGVKEKQENGQE